MLPPEQWREPDAALRRMYLDAQARAIEAYDWYLADRLRKRTWSWLLRAAAIILAAAGGLQPLISAASSRMSFAWGYVLLALAGISIGFDHFLGLSSGWMRDVAAAQRVQRRLQEFQLDWATLNARDALTPELAGVDVSGYLDLLRSFVTDMSAIMMEETAEWVAEFQSGISQLTSQATRG